jgi:hypothetical protein
MMVQAEEIQIESFWLVEAELQGWKQIGSWAQFLLEVLAVAPVCGCGRIW